MWRGLPPELERDDLKTTTTWRWRVVNRLVNPPTPILGVHQAFVDRQGPDARSVILSALVRVGQPGARVGIHELVPLQPAMVWLAREHGLNRLQSEAVASAMSDGARICVRAGNEGRLPEVAAELGLDVVVIEL